MSQPRPISRNFSLSDCHGGTRIDPHDDDGLQEPQSSDTAHTGDVHLRSAAQIGQRLAFIGDELNRTYKSRRPCGMARLLRASMRMASNCQAFVLNVLRSVTRITRRTGDGETAGQSRSVPATDSGWVYPKVLLAIVLVAVCAILVKLGFDE